MTADRRVDAYIAVAPAFAPPILTHLREVVRTACPDAVETVKWSTPFFDYHGPMCSLVALVKQAAALNQAGVAAG